MLIKKIDSVIKKNDCIKYQHVSYLKLILFCALLLLVNSSAYSATKINSVDLSKDGNSEICTWAYKHYDVEKKHLEGEFDWNNVLKNILFDESCYGGVNIDIS